MPATKANNINTYYKGNLRQRYFFRDRFEDEYYSGLLRHEWRGEEQLDAK